MGLACGATSAYVPTYAGAVHEFLLPVRIIGGLLVSQVLTPVIYLPDRKLVERAYFHPSPHPVNRVMLAVP